jgi:flavin-dependent dehydrogenase
MILESAQRTMAPYKLTYEYCDWRTAYQIGQRVVSNFSKNERIFLAGDAVHTHSPKAGQGMNVSMQDSMCPSEPIFSANAATSFQPWLEDCSCFERHIGSIDPSRPTSPNVDE